MSEGIVVVASFVVVLDLRQPEHQRRNVTLSIRAKVNVWSMQRGVKNPVIPVRFPVDHKGHFIEQTVGNARKGGLVFLERGVFVADCLLGEGFEVLVLQHVEQPLLVGVIAASRVLGFLVAAFPVVPS